MIDKKIELFLFLFTSKNLFIAIVTKLFLDKEEGKKKQFLSLILKCYWY